MFTWVRLHSAPDSSGNHHRDSVIEKAEERKPRELMTLTGKADRKSLDASKHHFKETRVS